jgi:hypothetical protein
MTRSETGGGCLREVLADGVGRAPFAWSGEAGAGATRPLRSPTQLPVELPYAQRSPVSRTAASLLAGPFSEPTAPDAATDVAGEAWPALYSLATTDATTLPGRPSVAGRQLEGEPAPAAAPGVADQALSVRDLPVAAEATAVMSIPGVTDRPKGGALASYQPAPWAGQLAFHASEGWAGLAPWPVDDEPRVEPTEPAHGEGALDTPEPIRWFAAQSRVDSARTGHQRATVLPGGREDAARAADERGGERTEPPALVAPEASAVQPRPRPAEGSVVEPYPRPHAAPSPPALGVPPGEPRPRPTEAPLAPAPNVATQATRALDERIDRVQRMLQELAAQVGAQSQAPLQPGPRVIVRAGGARPAAALSFWERRHLPRTSRKVQR